MKLQENKGKWFLYIPRSLVAGMDWQKGDDFEAKILGRDRLEIRKK